jgi:hypothetical protein
VASHLPPPVATPDGALEHEVQELLKFKMLYGRPHVLVRWAGCDASGDMWEPLDNLTNCEEPSSGRPVGPHPVLRLHRRAGPRLSRPRSRRSA